MKCCQAVPLPLFSFFGEESARDPVPRGRVGPVPRPGTEPAHPAVEAQSRNHGPPGKSRLARFKVLMSVMKIPCVFEAFISTFDF